jgi:hypothetical protein
MASRANSVDLAVVGLLVVVVGTHVFTNAAKNLGWRPVAVAGALYLAGRAAEMW